MGDEGLFGDLALQQGPEAVQGRPRLRAPVRDQIELLAVDIDSLIGEDHPARLIWAYVSRLDLGALEDAIKAREGRPGHPPAAPQLLMALWLYATSDGVGSARELARLCTSEDAYRWLCGGVSVNYHTLAEFRVGQTALLDRLLIENVAALLQAGVIDLSALTQDGVRVRASGGAASFRREATLERHLAQARAAVEQLKHEVYEDTDASKRRKQAARQRAARERLERIAAAQQALAEIAQQRARRDSQRAPEKHHDQEPPASPPGAPDTGKKRKQPRASTTDPQARVMKMADGGFRPAYNVQVASVANEQIVVAIDPCTTGSDRGLMRPMLEQVERCYGSLPERHFTDGGFGSGPGIDWAHGQGIAVYCPPTQSKHGTDPYAPRKDDGDGVRAWRARRARLSTSSVPSVSAFMPAGATGTSSSSPCVASKRCER